MMKTRSASPLPRVRLPAVEAVGGDAGERIDAAADIGEFRTRQGEIREVKAGRGQIA